MGEHFYNEGYCGNSVWNYHHVISMQIRCCHDLCKPIILLLSKFKTIAFSAVVSCHLRWMQPSSPRFISSSHHFQRPWVLPQNIPDILHHLHPGLQPLLVTPGLSPEQRIRESSPGRGITNQWSSRNHTYNYIRLDRFMMTHLFTNRAADYPASLHSSADIKQFIFKMSNIGIKFSLNNPLSIQFL